MDPDRVAESFPSFVIPFHENALLPSTYPFPRVSFPHCESEDGMLVIAWAGYDHLQLACAIAERYEQAKEFEGRKLVSLLGGVGQLIPWLKQWHNELDPVFGARLGDYFEDNLAEEAKTLGMKESSLREERGS